jgi:hypothetical protein
MYLEATDQAVTGLQWDVFLDGEQVGSCMASEEGGWVVVPVTKNGRLIPAVNASDHDLRGRLVVQDCLCEKKPGKVEIRFTGYPETEAALREHIAAYYAAHPPRPLAFYAFEAETIIESRRSRTK